MYLNEAVLTDMVDALRAGSRDIIDSVGEACGRVEALDGHIEAMIAEPSRRERLVADAQRLKKRFPDSAARPPLYGALVAVKDIYHVSGLSLIHI